MLSKLSVKKPYFVVVIVIIIMILGVVSYMGIGVDMLPGMNLPFVAVVTINPGADPESVERELSIPIENAISAVSNVKEVTATSSENFSLVFIEFNASANIDDAYNDVKNSLELVQLPDNPLIQEPMLLKINPTMLPIMNVSVSMSGMNTKESSKILSEVIDKVATVDGISGISTSGLVGNMAYMNISVEKLTSTLTDYAKEEFEMDFTMDKEAKKRLYDGLKKAGAAEMDEVGLLEAVIENLEDQNSEENNMTFVIDFLQSELDDINKSIEKGEEPDSVVYDICNEILDNKFIFNENANENLFYSMIDRITDASLNTMISTNLANVINSIDAGLLGTLVFAQDFEMPAGTITEGVIQTLIKVGPNIESREEFMTTPIISINVSDILKQYMSEVYNMLTLMSYANNGDDIYFTKAELRDGLATSFPDATDDEINDLTNQYIDSMEMMSIIVSEDAIFIPEDEESGKFMINFAVLDEDLNDIVIPITMEGIADVSFFDTSTTAMTYMLTQDESMDEFMKSGAIIFSVNKEPDKSTVDITEGVISYLTGLQGQEDYKGLQFTVLSNDGDMINFMLDTVISNLVYGALLAVLVLIIFLKNIRATFVVGFSIIVSVISTFVLMYFSNITLNIVSMGGLALGVGMLVDNSIVVLENIYRLKAQGKSKYVSAIQGAKQVGGAIMSSTLTTVIVFLPIAFIQGMTKEIFTDMALTICFSLVASLVCALTLVPMASSGFLKKPPKKEGKPFLMIKKSYVKLLNFNLNHKIVPLVIIIAMLGATIAMVLNMNLIMFPPTGSTSLTVTATVNRKNLEAFNIKNSESTMDFEDALDYALEQVEDTLNGTVMVKSNPDNLMDKTMVRYNTKFDDSWRDAIDSIGLRMSSGMSFGGMTLGDTAITANIVMKNEKERDISSIELGKILEDILNKPEVSRSGSFEVVAQNADIMSMIGVGSNTVSVHLNGDDLDLLREQATSFANAFNKDGATSLDKSYIFDDITDISTGLESSDQEYRLIVDRKKASKFNLTVAQVYLQIQVAMGSFTGDNGSVNLYDENGELLQTDMFAKGTNDYTDVWYNGTYEDGSEVKIFIKDNYSDILKKANYSIKNKNLNGLFVVGDNEFKFIEAEGDIPLTPVTIDGQNYYTYKYVDADETNGQMKQVEVKIKQVDEQMFYELGQHEPMNLEKLMELPIRLMDLSNFSDISMNSNMSSLIGNGEVVAKLYELLDDGCFLKDENNQVVMVDKSITVGEGDNETTITIEVPKGFKKVNAFRSINRVDKQRRVTITFTLEDDANSTVLKREIQSVIDGFGFNENVEAEMVVGSPYVNEVFNSLYLILGLAVVLIYLIMVGQFQSLKSPFIIMFTLPLAFIGGVASLFITGQPLSVMALMGMIVLVGVIVNNGIVFVDYCNQLIATGVPKRTALLRTGMDRLRPILMTAMTTIFALFITALDPAESADMLRPLAITTVGGLIFGTLMTLFIIPIMYDIFNRKKKQTDLDKLFRDKTQMAEMDVDDDGLDTWSDLEVSMIKGLKKVEDYQFITETNKESTATEVENIEEEVVEVTTEKSNPVEMVNTNKVLAKPVIDSEPIEFSSKASAEVEAKRQSRQEIMEEAKRRREELLGE